MIEFISNEILVLVIILLIIFYIILNYIYSKCSNVFSQIDDISIDVNNLSIETKKVNETSQKVESNLSQSLSKITPKFNRDISPKKKDTYTTPDFSLVGSDAKVIFAKLYEENPDIAIKTFDELIKEKEKKEPDIQHLYG